MRLTTSRLVLITGLVSTAYGIELDRSSEDSVNNALSSIAFDMMSYYDGNQTGEVPGLLPGPCLTDECYYWWEAGAMWAALINYQQYTGDTSYESTVRQALAFQIGPDKNYNPPNQSRMLGIDDQAFWGLAAIEAAEAGLPNSDEEGVPAWNELAASVFDFQQLQWDDATCDGGFRWQVFAFNAGYNLKNSISNGANFNLAARLARYTGNSTYADWATKVWDWVSASVLMETNEGTIYIWDNTDVTNGCADSQNFIWTANYAQFLQGAATMYNYTNGSSEWEDRTNTILQGAIDLFIQDDQSGIISEVLCENTQNCNNDQAAFKAILSRSMAVTSVIAPFTSERISTVLATSADAAARQCTGGDNGRMCGRSWRNGTWDGTQGVSEQLSALAVIGGTRMTSALAPLTASENSNTTTSNNGNNGNGNQASSGNGNGNGNGNGSGNGGNGPSAAYKSTLNSALLAMMTCLTVGASLWTLL